MKSNLCPIKELYYEVRKKICVCCRGAKWKTIEEHKDEYLGREDQNIKAIASYHLTRR